MPRPVATPPPAASDRRPADVTIVAPPGTPAVWLADPTATPPEKNAVPRWPVIPKRTTVSPLPRRPAALAASNELDRASSASDVWESRSKRGARDQPKVCSRLNTELASSLVQYPAPTDSRRPRRATDGPRT